MEKKWRRMDNLIIAQCGIWHIHGILDNKKKQMADTATGMNESQKYSLNEKRQITERGKGTETPRLIGSKEIP